MEGRLSADPATGGPKIWNGQDGQPRSSFEVNAQTVRFLSSRGETDTSMSAAGMSDEPPTTSGDENEIPF